MRDDFAGFEGSPASGPPPLKKDRILETTLAGRALCGIRLTGGGLAAKPLICPAWPLPDDDVAVDLAGAGDLNEDGRHAGCGRLRRSNAVSGFILDETRFSSRSPAGFAIGPRNAPAIL